MSQMIPVPDLRNVAAELDLRRNRIARTHRSLGVIVGAYDLVAADLRAAAALRDIETSAGQESAR